MTEPTDDPVLMIRGEKIGFAPIRREHAATFARWMSDLRVTRTLAISCKPMTMEAELAWIDHTLTSGEVIFSIYELSSMRLIGNTGLHDLNETLGTAEFGIAIGEPDAWGKGYATEATKLMLAYAFDVLGLHNVMLGTYSLNPAAVRAYEKAGFRHVGIRRGAMRVGRERHDIVLMDAVADDFPPSFLHDLMQGTSPPGPLSREERGSRNH